MSSYSYDNSGYRMPATFRQGDHSQPPPHPTNNASASSSSPQVPSSSRFPHAPPVNAGPLNVRDGQRKRSYKACLHCRSRKAKCDLGDITAPREPPCSRCRREGRRCEFAPSRRGGNVVGRKRRLLAIEQLKRQGAAERDAIEMVDRQEQERVRKKREGRAAKRANEEESEEDDEEEDDEDEAEAEEELRRMGVSAFQRPTQTQPPPPAAAAPPPGISYVPPPDQITTTQSVVSQTSPLRYAGLQSLLGSPANSLASISGSSPGNYPRNEEPPTTLKRHRPSLDAVTSTTLSSSRSPPDSKRPRHLHHHSAGGSSSLVKMASSATSSGDHAQQQQQQPPTRSTAQGIVRADMHNESDALAILAQASREVEHERPRSEGDHHRAASHAREDRSEEGEIAGASATPASPPRPPQAESVDPSRIGANMSADNRRGSIRGPADLNDFEPVQQGILQPRQIITLCEAFFRWHHHIFPIVGFRSIPHTPAQIAEFSRDEPDLLSAFIIIASRTHQEEGMRTIHERTWALFRTHLSDVTSLGAPSTVGLVEGLLLLAENLPRDPGLAARLRASDSREGVHGAENRQAWMLIGMAIRLAYGLGLDQIALYTDELVERTYATERATLAWTYCFLFDRHISLRLGKAFWSRGPSLCFRGFSHRNQTGPAAARDNFPTLSADDHQLATPSPGIDISGAEDDLGSLVQAYVELTQLMSNAHDVLYPSPVRTHSLVAHGEYFKFLDDFNTSLESFKAVWATKRWKTFPLTDIVWCQFHYVRLYISAFSFQAHVERASARAELEEANTKGGASPDSGEATNADAALRPKTDLFPRGGAASADARYIYESIRAATQILLICVDSLHPGGVLPYLPSRFHLFFQYAAVFLLKAIYSGAMIKGDTVSTLHLIERLCVCLASCSSDKDHPAVRYASMVMVLMKKLAGASNESQSHTRRPTPPPQEINVDHAASRQDGATAAAVDERKPFAAGDTTAASAASNSLVTGLSSLVGPTPGVEAAAHATSQPPPPSQQQQQPAQSVGDLRMHPLSHHAAAAPTGTGYSAQPPPPQMPSSSSSLYGMNGATNGTMPFSNGGGGGFVGGGGMQVPPGMHQQRGNGYSAGRGGGPQAAGDALSMMGSSSSVPPAWLPPQQQQQQQPPSALSSLPSFLANTGGSSSSSSSAFNIDGSNPPPGPNANAATASGGLGIPFDHLFEPSFVETNAMDGLYDFDLAEFWTKVYPGEANGGFPFR